MLVRVQRRAPSGISVNGNTSAFQAETEGSTPSSRTMKVKVGNRIYDGEKEPIMVVLTAEDKENIHYMGRSMRYCSFPGGYPRKNLQEWMNTDTRKMTACFDRTNDVLYIKREGCKIKRSAPAGDDDSTIINYDRDGYVVGLQICCISDFKDMLASSDMPHALDINLVENGWIPRDIFDFANQEIKDLKL